MRNSIFPRIPFIAALFFFLIAVKPVDLAAAGRVALFIGNNDYQFARKLKNPIRDASGLEARLKSAGYRTFLASDASVEGMTTQLELFYEAAKGAEIALLFYAGHGLEAEERNYLLPVDARLSIDESLSGDALTAAKRTVLKRETVALEGVLKELGATGAKLKLIVLDCCRDDPLPDRSWLSRTAGGGGTLAEVGEKDLAEGTMLVFSTEPGKRASDGASGGHSPFTGAVIESLAPGASILSVFTGAAGKMQQQEPWIKFDGSGKAMLGFGSVAMIDGALLPNPGPPSTHSTAAPVKNPSYNPLDSFPAPGPNDKSNLARIHELIDAFLRAPDVATRLKYTFQLDRLRATMVDYHNNLPYHRFDRYSLQFYQSELDVALGGPYWVFIVATGDGDEGFPLVVRTENGLLKVDWEIFAEFFDRRFLPFCEGTMPPPATFRLIIERFSDYYGSDRETFKDLGDYLVYQVNPPYGDLDEFSEFVLVKRDSEIAKKLEGVIRLGDEPLAVVLTLDKKAFAHGIEHFVITDLVNEGWFR